MSFIFRCFLYYERKSRYNGRKQRKQFLCFNDQNFFETTAKKASIRQQISYRNDAAKRSSSASPRESIKILKYKKKILQGETKQLDLINLPANATVSFSSNNTSVLTVKQISNTACEYSGMGYGNAKIQIKISTPGFLFFDNVQELTASINVTPKAVSIVFRKSTRTITVGQSSKLSYTIRPSISTEKPVFMFPSEKKLYR